MPVIVVGVGSSGTSMISGVIHNLGISMGQVFKEYPVTPGKWRRYEDAEMVFLSLFPIVKAPKVCIIQAIKFLASWRQEPWGFKNPHIATFIPWYAEALPNARWVWAKRSKQGTISSLKRNWGLNQKTANVYYHKRTDCISRDLPKDHYIAVYERFLKNPKTEVEELAKWLNVRPTKKAIDVIKKPKK